MADEAAVEALFVFKLHWRFKFSMLIKKIACARLMWMSWCCCHVPCLHFFEQLQCAIVWSSEPPFCAAILSA